MGKAISQTFVKWTQVQMQVKCAVQFCSSYKCPSAEHISHSVWQGFTVDAVKTKVFISIYYQLYVGQLSGSINKLNQSALTGYGEVRFDFSCARCLFTERTSPSSFHF